MCYKSCMKNPFCSAVQLNCCYFLLTFWIERQNTFVSDKENNAKNNSIYEIFLACCFTIFCMYFLSIFSVCGMVDWMHSTSTSTWKMWWYFLCFSYFCLIQAFYFIRISMAFVEGLTCRPARLPRFMASLTMAHYIVQINKGVPLPFQGPPRRCQPLAWGSLLFEPWTLTPFQAMAQQFNKHRALRLRVVFWVHFEHKLKLFCISVRYSNNNYAAYALCLGIQLRVFVHSSCAIKRIIEMLSISTRMTHNDNDKPFSPDQHDSREGYKAAEHTYMNNIAYE